MKTRIVFGLVLIAALVGVLWMDHWMGQRVGRAYGLPLAVIALGLVVVGFVEMAAFGLRRGMTSLRFSGLLGTIMLALLPYWWQFVSREPIALGVLLLLGLVLILAFAEQMIRCRTENVLRNLGLTTATVLYLGVGTALMVSMRVRYADNGIPVLVLFLAAVKSTDIGAYFTGSFIGRHKILPWVSPGKSWEGLAGGAVVAAAVSVLVVWATGLTAIAWWQAVIFGAVMAVAGQYADMCESLIKRSVSVKDSAALIPSFGGVLDLVDSPLLAAPVAYLLLLAFWG